jgi:hypothetical protein
MSAQSVELQSIYCQQGPMTDLKQYRPLTAGLPADLPGLVQTIQNWMIHIFWAERYGLKLSDERQAEVTIRPAWRKMARLLELDPAPLAQPRPLQTRLVGNCRDFTVMTVALLREKGFAARSRCGFGTYFLPNHYEDHWVCEYWSAQEARWVMADAQLDAFQQEVLHIPFDTLDMPAGAFVTGGAAWQMARSGTADPDAFGIFDMKGMDFIKGNLLRDLLALTRFEVLPWDQWGIVSKPYIELNQDELTLLDTAAEVAVQGDVTAALQLVAHNPGFPAPADWAD